MLSEQVPMNGTTEHTVLVPIKFPSFGDLGTHIAHFRCIVLFIGLFRLARAPEFSEEANENRPKSDASLTDDVDANTPTALTIIARTR